MNFSAKPMTLAALVLLTTGPSYGQPLRSTSIASSLANDEKRLLPVVMNEFYGSFEKETGYWIAKQEGMPDCVKPLRLDVRASNDAREQWTCRSSVQPRHGRVPLRS